jgi:hypothetical protein
MQKFSQRQWMEMTEAFVNQYGEAAQEGVMQLPVLLG